jgi:hypothetical protein
MGASATYNSAFIVPKLVSIVAEYFLDPSISIGGGAENCLDAEDTGAPWAAGEAEAAADGEAPGFGNGLSALDTWPAEGGVAGRVGALVGGAGAAFWPHAANGSIKTANSTAGIRNLNSAPLRIQCAGENGNSISRSSGRYLRYGGSSIRGPPRTNNREHPGP